MVLRVKNGYRPHLPGVGDVKVTIGKPLIQEPKAASVRPGGPGSNRLRDLRAFYLPKERRENGEIDSFPLECKLDMSDERGRRSMTVRQELPRIGRSRVMPQRDADEFWRRATFRSYFSIRAANPADVAASGRTLP